MTQTPFYTPLPTNSKTAPPSLKGTTLVLPAVSIGSVAQLAVDLLLHHTQLGLVKVGRLDPAFSFPFVGPSDSLDGQDVTTALEVYSNGAVTVVQQRAPVYKSLEREYVARLTQWMAESRFGEVLWLTSIDAAARTDAEFATPVLSLFPSALGDEPETKLLAALAREFPAFNPDERVSGVPHVPGSLLTRKLLQHVSTQDAELKQRLGALLYFAAEGDTRPDAHALANLVLRLLSKPDSTPLQHTSELTEPPSWSALFGRPPTSALYA